MWRKRCAYSLILFPFGYLRHKTMYINHKTICQQKSDQNKCHATYGAISNLLIFVEPKLTSHSGQKDKVDLSFVYSQKEKQDTPITTIKSFEHKCV